MGGSGSGSRFGSRYPLAERALQLPIESLSRAGVLRAGWSAQGTWAATENQQAAAIEIRVDASTPPQSYTITYTANGEPCKVTGALLRTRAGPGERFWLGCPFCKRRCGVLYVPRGGKWFACRLCHGLRYTCQREARVKRLERRSRKFYGRAGSTSYGLEYTYRPKGMHERTFNGLMDEAERLDHEAFFESTLGKWILRQVR